MYDNGMEAEIVTTQFSWKNLGIHQQHDNFAQQFIRTENLY